MTADDEYGGMVVECPHCDAQMEIPRNDLGVDAVAGLGPGGNAVETASDEAVLFAEQMGIEVESRDTSAAADNNVAGHAEYEGLEHDPQAAADLDFGEMNTSAATRFARVRRSQAAAQRRNQHHFRKSAIPLMLIMSGLLMIIAIWSTIDLAGTPTESIRQRATIMMVSWPVILILIFGAWWFHRDIRRSEQ